MLMELETELTETAPAEDVPEEIVPVETESGSETAPEETEEASEESTTEAETESETMENETIPFSVYMENETAEIADTEAIVEAIERQTEVITYGFTGISIGVGLIAGAVVVQGFRLRRV